MGGGGNKADKGGVEVSLRTACCCQKFERAVQTFATSLPPFGVGFFRLMARVLPPNGASFASLS